MIAVEWHAWLAGEFMAGSQGRAAESWDTSYRVTGLSPGGLCVCVYVCETEGGGVIWVFVGASVRLSVCRELQCRRQCLEPAGLYQLN